MFTPSLLAELKSEAGFLHELAEQNLEAANTLTLLTRLRKKYSAPFAAAALETARLRKKAVAKFRHADEMFFTAEALQQATTETLATHHAQLLQNWSSVADLGCSIGGDAIALGQLAFVLGLDLDVTRLWMARHNAAVYGANTAFVQGDLTAPLPLQHIECFFFDPARRMGEKRLFSVEDYQPPLSILYGWDFRAGLVKLSPGVDLEELQPFPVGVEFVSEGGELKEALLHVGELAFSGRRATRLPEGETLDPEGYDPPPVIQAPLRYLYEPDPAVIRSGLFGEMLARLDLEAYRLDETIAYLTGDTDIESPWLRAWKIHDWMPFNLKRLKKRLVEKRVGQVTVKKRGSPLTPEGLQKMLGLKGGDHHAVLILTQVAKQHSVLISYDVPN
jgi:hypothetical protein